jgi:hypothetical protein
MAVNEMVSSEKKLVIDKGILSYYDCYLCSFFFLYLLYGILH